MTVMIGPSWPGRIIAAWMLSVFVKPLQHRTVDDDLADLRAWQVTHPRAHGRVVLRVRLSEQQLSWETLGPARGQWSVAREGPDTATIRYTP